MKSCDTREDTSYCGGWGGWRWCVLFSLIFVTFWKGLFVDVMCSSVKSCDTREATTSIVMVWAGQGWCSLCNASSAVSTLFEELALPLVALHSYDQTDSLCSTRDFGHSSLVPLVTLAQKL